MIKFTINQLDKNMIRYFIRERIPISVLSLLIALCFNFACETEKPVYFEEGTKKVNGAQLYYKIIGEGEPIVVLHGGPGFEHTYLYQLEKLAERFRVIFYDQRGTGRSSENIDSASITIDNFVEDLERLRKEFGLKKMNLLGHSWGGLLGLFYGIKYPENINSLMLICTAPARSGFWEEVYSNIDLNRQLKDSIALAEIRASKDYKNNKPEAHEKFRKIFFKSYFYNQDLADSLNMNFTPTTIKNLPIVFPPLLGTKVFNILDQLSAIDCPTLIVCGDSDVIPLKYSEEIQRNIPKSKLVEIKNSGHFPYIEKPDEFFEVISDFIEGHN